MDAKNLKLSVQPSLITAGAGIVATSPPSVQHVMGGVARVGDQAHAANIHKNILTRR